MDRFDFRQIARARREGEVVWFSISQIERRLEEKLDRFRLGG